jgi:integrase
MSVGQDKRTGKWVVRWRAAGVHHAKSFTYKADADRFDRERRRARELGVAFMPERGSETLAEFVEIWWSEYVVPRLARATRNSYLAVWDRHIRPVLGGYSVREISPSVLDSYRVSLEAQGTGEATVAKSLAILSGVFRLAVLRGLIPQNPMREIRSPKVRRQRFVVPASPWSVEQIRGEMLARDRLRDAVLVSVLGYAGLRPGEALALRWEDVGAATLKIERAVALGEIKRTKTGRLRTVRMMRPLAEDLAHWRAECGGSSDDFVFANARGAVWSEYDWDNWRDRIFKRAARQAGRSNREAVRPPTFVRFAPNPRRAIAR